MRLILGATRPDKKNVGAANFRVYLKLARQANGGVPKDAADGAALKQQERRTGKNIPSGQRLQITERKDAELAGSRRREGRRSRCQYYAR
jgi:hypothetical protein